ncbi:aKG-HExxH-type peptide beta-hydroxylase [Legionella cardiaca]|uniref:HEXXH motif-containing putative peptide modification protein n=1 Tax=Legionella cardiaca TaxID=1071983 RepID=A0ABY8AUQ8_9GAMM|nr:HEXXH motif-containing putative peptide modification protein [Legionella cardiaca]WED44432.1 HEXXH motif-containing putative peptide modification protein [Legionella cardiaca]
MKNSPVPLDQVSAVPKAHIAETLYKAYKQRFIHSFIQLIKYAQQVLHKDFNWIVSELGQLELYSASFISPWLYSQYFKLLESMKKDDIFSVEQTIQDLADTNCWLIHERLIALGLKKEWEKKVFVEEVSIAFGSDHLKAFSPPEKELEKFEIAVSDALKLITEADNHFINEINSFVSTINLVKSNLNVGATSPKFFGAIYLSLPDNLLPFHRLFLVEHLVHETSHLYLNAVIAYDPLVLNEVDERFISPIRTDLRPMLGVYHAAFVLSRVLRIFKQIQQLKLFDNRQILNQSIANLTKKYKAAFDTAHNLGILTTLGQQILLSTKECALM